MNTILNITKNELRKLFYSPVAWLVLIIFCIQCSMLFTNIFDNFLFWKRGNVETSFLTYMSFAGSTGLYSSAQGYIYLYISLITMGIMSQEFSTGSVKLLYSSPVTNTQIVIGKYIALLFFNLALITVLFVFSAYSLFSIQHAEIPLVLCGLFGLFLLIAAYQAIGLFMSSLSSYIVVAALGTFGIFSVLSFVGSLGQDVAYLRDVTYWLSINSRAGTFIRGMITSEDIIYFIILSVLFLVLTIFYLKFKRQPSTFIKRLSAYGAAILITISIGCVSSLPDLKGYLDASREKFNTLTKNSQEIVSKLPNDITITTYVNVLARNSGFLAPNRFKSEQDRYEQFIRFKPRLKLEYVYYYHKVQNENTIYKRTSTKSEKEMLDSVMNVFRWKFDVIPYADIRPKVNLASEDFQQVSLIRGSNNKTAWLRTFDDGLVLPFESEISAALKRINQKLPVVGVVTGHGERSIHSSRSADYQQFTLLKRYRSSLINQGFDLREVSLDKPVDEDINILLLADPKNVLNIPQNQNLRHYLASGRNMMVLGEPGRQDYLNPLLKGFGLQLLPGTLIDSSQKADPDLMALKPSAQAIAFSPYFRDMSLRQQVLYMPTAAGINISDKSSYQIQVLFESGANSWNTNTNLNVKPDSSGFAGNSEKKRKAYPTAVALSKKVNGKTQKIIVTGDADFLSTAVLNQNYQERSGNYGFIYAAFSWLSDGISPVDVHRPEGIDNQIKIDDKIWDTSSFVLRWIYPLILIVVALIIYIRRRNR
jgi:ABC-2 type transport system permease protein